jgi:hypothetical protein
MSQGLAANTSAIAISVAVLTKNACSFNTGSQTATLGFPAIDPSSSSNVTASVNLSIRCTGSGNPVVYSIASNDGLHKLGPGQPQMADTGAAHLLAYTLNTPLSGSVPKNTDSNVTITGTITRAQFANAVPASYTDSVVLTVSPP